MRLKHIIPVAAVTIALIAGCGKKDHGHDHDEPAAGGHKHGANCSHGADKESHDGFLEVGEHVAHIKVDHDEKAGTLTLEIFDTSMKNALKIKEAPVLNLTTGEKKTQVKTVAVDGDDAGASKFTASGDALKAHPQGRIAIKVNGTAYQVELLDSHEGHDHDEEGESDDHGDEDEAEHKHGAKCNH